MAAKGVHPPWRLRAGAVPVGWEREGDRSPPASGEEAGQEAVYSTHAPWTGRSHGDERRGCVHRRAEQVLPEATQGWVFFPLGI